MRESKWACAHVHELGKDRERENPKWALCCQWRAWHRARTMSSWPKPKSRVRCLTDWATQVPLAPSFLRALFRSPCQRGYAWPCHLRLFISPHSASCYSSLVVLTGLIFTWGYILYLFVLKCCDARPHLSCSLKDSQCLKLYRPHGKNSINYVEWMHDCPNIPWKYISY